MTHPVRLVLALHNHQPIGNFDGVFEAAYQDSYQLFLDVLDEFSEFPVVLHNSGSLLEWLESNHPEYIDRVRDLVAAGRAEILGGPYFEPILSAIPRHDRFGQIRRYKDHLEATFSTKVRGMWVPERVWEQSFTCEIVDAGIEYTMLDDSHLRNAGLTEDQLHGYYLTEESGRLLKVFADSERLRYQIPYADPWDVVNYCRSIGDRFPNAILTFGDDGEKFGVWPGSKEHVYRNGWLRRFFQALRESRDWLHVTTMAEAVDHVSPLGKIYIPDASYREMMEWSLPTDRQTQYRQFVGAQEQRHDWFQFKQFIRAGFWRNFLVKYPEVNEMYTRMLQVSQRVEQLETQPLTVTQKSQLDSARQELYRGQCNCPYWHGAFGGLYLPHLRHAIYQHLIAADGLLDQVEGKTGRWVAVHAHDYNLDARKEIRLASDQLIAYCSPGKGGHLYELDVRKIRQNLLATLDRRPEPYHDKIREHAATAQVGEGVGGGVDPNGVVRFKQAGLDQKLSYDSWPRKSLVDHFFRPGLSFDEFRQSHGEMGDFTQGVYQSKVRWSDSRAEARMWRTGKLGPYQVQISKTVAVDQRQPGQLEIRYDLDQLPAGLPVHFGVEFNFAGLPAGAVDRFYYDEHGHRLGQLESELQLEQTSRIGLVDEWLGIDLVLESSQSGGFWTFPIQTVSQSESGFELVHQQCCVVPHWEIMVPEEGRWSVTLNLSIDTSAVQARDLMNLVPTGKLIPCG